jgi:two-component system phosphate regulon sensor histidine kinase PhoR
MLSLMSLTETRQAIPAVDAPPEKSYRSRAGDFFFAGVAGGIVLLGAFMLSDLAIAPALALGTVFGGALLLRYYSLREAQPVAPGVTFNEEQLLKFERLRAVLNALPQPIMLLDASDHVEMTNPACGRVFGMEPVGKHVSALVRSPAALDALRAARHAGTAKEAEFALPGASPRHCLFYAAPLADDQSAPKGRAVVMVRDRTAQKKLERMRTDFIANASHELRTPLASLLGFIETIEGHAKDDPAAQARFLGIMRTQAERMLRLVQDLVSLSAIELAEAEAPSTDVDLRAVARGVCEMMAPLAARAGGAVEGPGEGPPLMAKASRDELVQVVQNLIDNALKYGGDAPRVAVLVGRGAPPSREGTIGTGDTAAGVAARLGVLPSKVAWVQVSDDGEGVTRTDLPRLTERFYRIDAEKSRAKGGTGLGLAIVKHILTRHRGGLRIDSAEGVGTSFTCFLPPAEAARAVPQRDVLDKRTERA